MARALRFVAFLLLVLGIPAGWASPDEPPLLAGFAVVDITPAKNVPLGGYAARFGKVSDGVHDPVKARAMVLAKGEKRLAIVSVDLVGVSREAKAAVVEATKARGFTTGNLLLAATHNHSGPGALTTMPLFRPMMGPYDADLFRETMAKVADAVARADTAKKPARLAWGSTKADGLQRNRAVEGGPVDPTLDVLRVDGEDGKPMGLVVRFGAHPTILGADNLKISAEWPGAMCDTLEAKFPGATALFLQGVSGDVSPAGGTGEGFDRVASYGRAVADIAAALSPEETSATFASRARMEALPPTIAGALLGRGKGSLVPDDRLHFEIQEVWFGSGDRCLRWLATPSEPTTRWLKSPRESTTGWSTWPRVWSYGSHVVSCANDHVGYWTGREEFRAGGYEGSLDVAGPDTSENKRIPWGIGPGGSKQGPHLALVSSGHYRDALGAWMVGFAQGTHLKSDIHVLLRRAEAKFLAEAEKSGALAALLPAAIATGLPPKELVIPMLVRAARTLQKHIPEEYLDEMEGIAAGAGVPYDSILLENTFLTLSEQGDPAALLNLGPRCTNVAAFGDATTLGQPVLMSTIDWGMKDVLKDSAIVLAVEPPTGHPFVSVTWPGMVGTLRAMSAQGIAVSEESIGTKTDTSMNGVPINFLLRQVVQHANDLDEAVRMVSEAKGTAGYHVTVLDGHRRDARVLEVTATKKQVRKPVSGLLCGCDPTDAACFEGACDPSIPRADASSTARYAASRDVLGAAAGRIDARFGMTKFPLAKGVWNDDTLLAVVFEPQVGRFHVSLGGDLDFDATSGTPRWKTHDLKDLFPAATWTKYAPPPKVESAGTFTTGTHFRFGNVIRTPVSFDSPLKTGIARNDRVHAFWFAPAEAEPKGAVIQLPAWHEKDLTAESLLSMALAARGLGVLLFPLPYQAGRAPDGVGPGDWTLSPDLSRTREAWMQGAADVCRASLWLEAEKKIPPARQGVLGVSLGGHVAGVAYGAYPARFSAGVFILAGGDLDLLLSSKDSAVLSFRRRMDERGVEAADVKDLVGPLDPARWADPARKDGVFLVGAKADDIVPAAHVEALSRAYGGARVLWFEGGHYDGLLQPQKISEILSAAGDHLLQRFSAPAPGERPPK